MRAVVPLAFAGMLMPGKYAGSLARKVVAPVSCVDAVIDIGSCMRAGVVLSVPVMP